MTSDHHQLFNDTSAGRIQKLAEQEHQDTCGDGGTDNTGNVWTHGVHEQEVGWVLLLADNLGKRAAIGTAETPAQAISGLIFSFKNRFMRLDNSTPPAVPKPNAMIPITYLVSSIVCNIIGGIIGSSAARNVSPTRSSYHCSGRSCRQSLSKGSCFQSKLSSHFSLPTLKMRRTQCPTHFRTIHLFRFRQALAHPPLPRGQQRPQAVQPPVMALIARQLCAA